MEPALSSPQKPVFKPYKTVNGLTHRPSCQQISTVLIFTLELILHVLYILPMQLPWQFVSSIFVYLLLATTTGLYIYLSVYDPVDPLVKHPLPESSQQSPAFSSKHCPKCNRTVGLASKHCYVCQRCCADFDHHCNYLNNCIGDSNYKQFLALVSVATLFECVLFAQGVFVLVKEFGGDGKRERWATWDSQDARWAVLVLVILSGLVLTLQVVLIGLHGYLRCLLNMSTYQWIKKDDKKKNVEMKYQMSTVLPQSSSTRQQNNENVGGNVNI